MRFSLPSVESVAARIGDASREAAKKVRNLHNKVQESGLRSLNLDNDTFTFASRALQDPNTSFTEEDFPRYQRLLVALEDSPTLSGFAPQVRQRGQQAFQTQLSSWTPDVIGKKLATAGGTAVPGYDYWREHGEAFKTHTAPWKAGDWTKFLYNYYTNRPRGSSATPSEAETYVKQQATQAMKIWMKEHWKELALGGAGLAAMIALAMRNGDDSEKEGERGFNLRELLR